MKKNQKEPGVIKGLIMVGDVIIKRTTKVGRNKQDVLMKTSPAQVVSVDMENKAVLDYNLTLQRACRYIGYNYKKEMASKTSTIEIHKVILDPGKILGHVNHNTLHL